MATSDTNIIKPDVEKSQQQAVLMSMMSPYLLMLDRNYLEMAAKEIMNRARNYNSMAALMPNWRPEKSELMVAQARAIQALVNYIDSLKEVDAAKQALGKADDVRDEIMAMFT